MCLRVSCTGPTIDVLLELPIEPCRADRSIDEDVEMARQKKRSARHLMKGKGSRHTRELVERFAIDRVYLLVDSYSDEPVEFRSTYATRPNGIIALAYMGLASSTCAQHQFKSERKETSLQT